MDVIFIYMVMITNEVEDSLLTVYIRAVNGTKTVTYEHFSVGRKSLILISYVKVPPKIDISLVVLNDAVEDTNEIFRCLFEEGNL